mgnify:CR=1 FL=1
MGKIVDWAGFVDLLKEIHEKDIRALEFQDWADRLTAAWLVKREYASFTDIEWQRVLLEGYEGIEGDDHDLQMPIRIKNRFDDAGHGFANDLIKFAHDEFVAWD